MGFSSYASRILVGEKKYEWGKWDKDGDKDGMGFMPLMRACFVWKQVTWVHTVVAEGWEGACNPHIHPCSPYTHSNQKQSQLQYQNCTFSHYSIWSSQMNGPTDRWTDGQSLLRSCVSATKKNMEGNGTRIGFVPSYALGKNCIIIEIQKREME